MKAVAIVLAAGKGTRMRSDLPKVLHRLRGRPLVEYPLRAAARAGVEQFVVVVGHGAQSVEAAVNGAAIGSTRFALQAEQNGTGHAVLCALPELSGHNGPVLILSGDVPLLTDATLTRLAQACEQSPGSLAFVTFRPEDPSGYGRIIRDAEGNPQLIREHRDASPEELAVDECNAGIYCVSAEHLRTHLPRLGSTNAQGEIYLTDLVEVVAREAAVATIEVEALEVAGVNTVEQLASLETEAESRGL